MSEGLSELVGIPRVNPGTEAEVWVLRDEARAAGAGDDGAAAIDRQERVVVDQEREICAQLRGGWLASVNGWSLAHGLEITEHDLALTGADQEVEAAAEGLALVTEAVFHGENLAVLPEVVLQKRLDDLAEVSVIRLLVAKEHGFERSVAGVATEQPAIRAILGGLDMGSGLGGEVRDDLRDRRAEPLAVKGVAVQVRVEGQAFNFGQEIERH